MENLYYPTGNGTGGRTIVCLCCENDVPVFESLETPSEIEKSIKEWLDKNDYCIESWQIDNKIKECGYLDYSLSEMEGGPSLGTLNTTDGMGPVSTPGGDGTNSGFYDVNNIGSGDKFSSLSVRTTSISSDKRKKKRKGKIIKNFDDFLASGRFLQGK